MAREPKTLANAGPCRHTRQHRSRRAHIVCVALIEAERHGAVSDVGLDHVVASTLKYPLFGQAYRGQHAV